ncbi:MAG: subtype I-B CRISPR-associated endonuclease Cas1 [Caldisericum exile]|uniref:CRISPR-associated endonuclease Cas1 n=2 Tax=Caldisericum TaxID=693074 RepID=A0A2J6WF62_9BACT|nr:MAG: subtype I-B CRISPR-associated endonuclease Cas1 [Caldisericum exile]
MNEVIYIFKSGRIARKDNTLFFESDAEKRYIPVENTKIIHVFGEITINKDALEFLSQKEIILHFYNYYEYYIGSFYPREHYNSGYMIVNQVKNYLDSNLRLKLAKKFVLGSISNMERVLSYYSRRGFSLSDIVNSLRNIKDSMDEVSDVKELLALEGKSREIYYNGFSEILKDTQFIMRERSRRPPKDRINALISFGNSLLYPEILSQIYKTHLDPRIGYLHESNFRSFSLNLDVSEIFKPIIVDRTIFTLINKNMVDESSFEKRLNGIYLNERGARDFVKVFDERLNATINHKGLGRNVSYRTLIRLELYKIEKHIMGEKEYSPFVSEW